MLETCRSCGCVLSTVCALPVTQASVLQTLNAAMRAAAMLDDDQWTAVMAGSARCASETPVTLAVLQEAATQVVYLELHSACCLIVIDV